MSTSSFSSSSDRAGWLRPWYFITGFLAGLLLLSWAGRHVSATDYHKGFTRFHPMISPENYYLPTVAEMSSMVRSRCRSDQVLVLVGGNSIHYGVGQPPGKIWTDELQRRLGDRFCVINFAFRGASVTDGAALIAEVLREEFPKQIYVANTSPVLSTDPLGTDGYRFLFWEAYHKDLLMDWPSRTIWTKDYDRRKPAASPSSGNQLSARLDQALRYRDLWNWVGWNYVFTVSAPLNPYPPALFRPKRRFADTEPDVDAIPVGQRYRADGVAIEMQITRGFFTQVSERSAEGGWRVTAASREDFLQFAEMAIPGPLKSRTLIVLSQNSPFYLEKLTTDERQRNDVVYATGVELWQEAGYAAMTYGPGLTAADFVDRTHLTARGGVKLAHMVAPQITEIAKRLGYLGSSDLSKAP
jgi:lysophospholipase L1-like esterase